MLKKLVKIIITAVIGLTLLATLTACDLISDAGTRTGSPKPTDTPAPTEAVVENTATPEAVPEAEPTAHVETLDPELLPQFLPLEEGEEIAVFTTSMGEIKIRLFRDYAPLAVENFVTLAKDGYYSDMIFHRVINQFVIQTGDPTGTGMGGASIYGEGFVTEVTPHLHFFRGAVGMARGEDFFSNGSQFFFVQNDTLDETYTEVFEEYRASQDNAIEGTDGKLKDFYPIPVLDRYIEEGGAPFLDLGYTVFGQIYEGMDVVDAIAAVETDGSDKPVEDVQLISVEIREYRQ